ncbi:MAG: TetR/AcrR family transcriptional regulator [Leifsonia sp.]
MAAEASARRRSRVETAGAIERAAIALVLEHGYDGVTVDMICEAAGVSQRTFFNYFKTKDAALLGSALPEVDPERAAAFVDSDGPFLAEAIGLIHVGPEVVFHDEKLFADRMRAVASHPELLGRQMERLASIENELRRLILARLRRTAGAESTELEVQAEFIVNVVAGAMRFLGQAIGRSIEDGTPPPDQQSMTAVIASVLPKLG